MIQRLFCISIVVTNVMTGINVCLFTSIIPVSVSEAIIRAPRINFHNFSSGIS